MHSLCPTYRANKGSAKLKSGYFPETIDYQREVDHQDVQQIV